MARAWLERLKLVAVWLKAIFSRRDVLFSIAMMVAVWGAWPAFEEAFTEPDFSRHWRQDCDLVLIHKGLVEHPRFRDTLEWWTGTWVGQVPFWRPLTSLLFWLEWKAFGWEFQDAWMLVHLSLYLLAVAVAFESISVLTGSPAVAAAGICLSIFAPPHPLLRFMWSCDRAHALWDTVMFWKNTPDLLLALLAFGLIYALGRGRYGTAMILSLVAPGLKETGFAAPIVALLWLLSNRRYFLAAFLTVLTAGIATVKLHASGIGYAIDTVSPIYVRMLRYIVPAQLGAIISQSAGGLALVGLATAVVLLGKWRHRWAIASLLCMAGFGLLLMRLGSSAIGVVLDYDGVRAYLAAIIWGIGALGGICSSVLILSGLFVVFALPPVYAIQVWPHAYFVAYLFQGAATAAAWNKAWQRYARM